MTLPPLHAQTTFQVIHHLGLSDGYEPNGLARDSTGNIFGTTSGGRGTVFKIDPSHMFTVVYAFSGAPDGSSPRARVTPDNAGNLYGTTAFGGSNDQGTIFKIDSSGTETIMRSFKGSGGSYPFGSLTLDPAGNLYGTTQLGGALNNGVVFRINASGTGRILHKFSGPDGSRPRESLVKDAAGNLYGTTVLGGDYDRGTVFKLAPDGMETVLHHFTSGADGAYPTCELILDSAGNLYGEAAAGGAFSHGTVFKLDSSGVFSILHSFLSQAEGDDAIGGLVMDSAGNLYGVTLVGGDFGAGNVFKIDPSGNETVLYSFTGGSDGLYPSSTLLLSPDGTLYGTTLEGGNYGHGTVFKIKR